jgi:hypothetical protein
MNYSLLDNEIQIKNTIADTQGLEYEKKYNSIANKSVEGFSKMYGENSVTKKNDSDLNELINLQEKYQQKMSDYSNAYKLLMDNTNEYFNIMKSPLLNKNIRLANGTIGYVTTMGIFRPYQSMETFNKIIGINGCPSNFTEVQATINNNKVTTDPPFMVGRPMEIGDSCGNEGKNVVVTSTGQPGNPKYQGCYKYTYDAIANGDIKYQPIGNNGGATIDSCRQAAHDTGSSVFGLATINNNNNEYTYCFTGKDIEKIKTYGKALLSQVSWETPGSLNAIYAEFNFAGQLTIIFY